jgi:hypothetical protein
MRTQDYGTTRNGNSATSMMMMTMEMQRAKTLTMTERWSAINVPYQCRSLRWYTILNVVIDAFNNFIPTVGDFVSFATFA